jgi:ParB-like chromosome segregation protein Spo0J
MKKQEAGSKKQEAGRKKPRARAVKNGLPGRLVIRTLELSKINEAAYNPRKRLRPGDEEWAQLEASIKSHGYVDPLIWNKRTGNLVGGHQRLGVMRALHPELKSIDVSVVDVDLVHEKAMNLALNKVKGAWDQVALPALLEELAGDKSLADFGGMAATGFSEEEFKAISQEGERLVELLVPGDEEDKEKKKEKGKGGEEPRKKKGASVAELWQVVVECSGEREQKKLFEQLSGEGYKCKVLTM